MARREGADLSLGEIATRILGDAVRPFLSKWHPLLADFESSRQAGKPPVKHEREWASHAECRLELSRVRDTLDDYARALESAAGVDSIRRH